MKITFDLRGGRIVLEGTEADSIKLLEAVKAVAPAIKHITLDAKGESPTTEFPLATVSVIPGMTASPSTTSLRDFARSLPTSSYYERVATIAYFVAKREGRASFTPKEMEDWFGLCGFKKPSNMRVILADAKHKYAFVTNRGRGQWVINTAGENLVLELQERLSKPNGGGV